MQKSKFAEKLKILLVEDDEDDYLLVFDYLKIVSTRKYDLVWAQNYTDGLRIIQEQDFHAALVDFKIDTGTGLEFIRMVTAKKIDCPLILLTGVSSHDIDTAAQAAGASDYLCKGSLTAELLERSIRYAMEHATRKRLVDTILNTIDVGVIALDANNNVLLLNPLARSLVGLDNVGDYGPDNSIGIYSSVFNFLGEPPFPKAKTCCGEKYDLVTTALPDGGNIVLLHKRVADGANAAATAKHDLTATAPVAHAQTASQHITSQPAPASEATGSSAPAHAAQTTQQPQSAPGATQAPTPERAPQSVVASATGPSPASGTSPASDPIPVPHRDPLRPRPSGQTGEVGSKRPFTPSPTRERKTSTRMHGLVVSDNRAHRTMTSAHLINRGCTIDAVISMQEAIDACRQTHYDFVTLDMHDPMATAREWMAEFSNGAIKPPAQVCLFVTHMEPELQQACSEAQICRYFVKPIDWSEVFEHLTTAANAATNRPAAQSSTNPG